MNKKDIKEILLSVIPISLVAIVGVIFDVIIWTLCK